MHAPCPYDIVLGAITDVMDRQRTALTAPAQPGPAPDVTDYLHVIHQAVQALYLTSAISRIAVSIPTASAFTVSTSDQDYYGFVLDDVELSDGTQLSSVDPELLDEVSEAVWGALSSLDWSGPIEHSRSGRGRVFMDGRTEAVTHPAERNAGNVG